MWGRRVAVRAMGVASAAKADAVRVRFFIFVWVRSLVMDEKKGSAIGGEGKELLILGKRKGVKACGRGRFRTKTKDVGRTTKNLDVLGRIRNIFILFK
jgi:hypothetical protein